MTDLPIQPVPANCDLAGVNAYGEAVTHLALAICSVEGEILRLVNDGHDESADVVQRLVRVRYVLRSFWLPRKP